jgi:hypothetical protein
MDLKNSRNETGILNFKMVSILNFKGVAMLNFSCQNFFGSTVLIY